MLNACPKKNIFVQLLTWHFVSGLKEMLKGWLNLLRFNLRYFSIGLLLKTLFSHWRRYQDSYGRGFDIKVYAETFVGNMISRILGAFIRLLVILIGLITEVLIFLGGLVLIIFWIALPFLILFGLYVGTYLLL